MLGMVFLRFISFLLVSAKTFQVIQKLRSVSSLGFRPFLLPLFSLQNINNVNKGTHFIGQPMYGQLIFLLDKAKILKFSRENGGERYVKHFDAWQHLVIMLYAVIKRFDSLREITDSMFPEARKFSHLGISMMPRRSTLSDANARRPEGIFEAAYRDLYATYKDELSSDSPLNQITLAQAIETELPAEILLWRECQCHQEMQTSRYLFACFQTELVVF